MPTPPGHGWIASALMVVAAAIAPGAAASAAEELRQQHHDLRAAYRAELEGLSERLATVGHTAAAEAVAGWLPEVQSHQLLVWPADPAPPPNLPNEFTDAFAKLRQGHAKNLFSLARSAADKGYASLALRLATETIREDPQHDAARRLLGFQQIDGEWLTPYEARMRRAGQVWHERFGWIRREDVPRYEAGERRLGRNWISAEQDATRRQRSIEDGWVIPMQHFQVTTNHSLAAGVALASRLEELHAVWRQVFADYWLSGRELQAAFAGRRQAVLRGRPHQVWYFRTREEYNQALRREQPRIDMTLGIYFDTHRRCYFFAGEEQHPATISHEAVHQLFHESQRTTQRVGLVDNFWAIEGVATYFESFTIFDDPHAGRYYTLGGADAGRLPTARARLLEEGYYLPLEELVRLGQHDLQQRDDLFRLYSQLAGLATFFMHGQEARYRHAFGDYLAAVYRGRADAQTLSKVTGQPYEALDRQYREFLDQLGNAPQ